MLCPICLLPPQVHVKPWRAMVTYQQLSSSSAVCLLSVWRHEHRESGGGGQLPPIGRRWELMDTCLSLLISNEKILRLVFLLVSQALSKGRTSYSGNIPNNVSIIDFSFLCLAFPTFCSKCFLVTFQTNCLPLNPYVGVSIWGYQPNKAKA